MVIFIVIVLATLGLFTVSSSLAGLRFAEKSVASNADYYALDTKAEELYAEADGILFESGGDMTAAASALASLAVGEHDSLIVLPFYADNNSVKVTAISIEASLSDGNRSSLRLTLDSSAVGRRVIIREWRLVNAPFEYELPEDLWVLPQFGD
ncbi:MAG: hypothetical protein LBK41_00085 [Clostridiales bacterium]|jgi:hypothetical protein|nr:hypothetical protein [Clostridiales bacterium]